MKRTIVLLSAALFVFAVASGQANAKNSSSSAQITSQTGTVAEAPSQTKSRGGSTASEDTYFTFSLPVALAGVMLPPGTYLFRHLPPALTSHRHVVQVLSADRKKVYATLLAVPITRLTPSSKPVIVFSETPVGQPDVIKAWFYPGEHVGDEFVLPAAVTTEEAR
ncbi:MAG TPA: hypothetical protein VNE16_16405 [Vicinamibacterales bacterium]|nr:hypothetical protein [Vicinamibacterales bacterium]